MKKFLPVVLLVALFLPLVAQPVFAQGFQEFGRNTLKQAGDIIFGSVPDDPAQALPHTIARIIRALLTFLGMILLVLILYGGFLWMTAGGNEENVKKARQILTNAFIGLIIVFLAWAISAFIFNVLIETSY